MLQGLFEAFGYGIGRGIFSAWRESQRATEEVGNDLDKIRSDRAFSVFSDFLHAGAGDTGPDYTPSDIPPIDGYRVGSAPKRADD